MHEVRRSLEGLNKMIVKQYIKDFEKLGLGMFVNYGFYSIIGTGEWTLKLGNGVDEKELIINNTRTSAMGNFVILS